jgi:hypothetical protein
MSRCTVNTTSKLYIVYLLYTMKRWNLVQRLGSGLILEQSWLDFLYGQTIFILLEVFIPALGSTLSPTQWATDGLFPGSKGLSREADHSRLSSAHVRNEWSSTSLPHMSSQCLQGKCFLYEGL